MYIVIISQHWNFVLQKIKKNIEIITNDIHTVNYITSVIVFTFPIKHKSNVKQDHKLQVVKSLLLQRDACFAFLSIYIL